MPSYTPIPSTKMSHQARTSQVIYLDAADLMGHPCCSADMCWLMLLPDELLSLSSLSLAGCQVGRAYMSDKTSLV